LQKIKNKNYPARPLTSSDTVIYSRYPKSRQALSRKLLSICAVCRWKKNRVNIAKYWPDFQFFSPAHRTWTEVCGLGFAYTFYGLLFGPPCIS